MTDEKPDEKPETTASFEKHLGELEKVVGELERGNLPLADALQRFEKGVGHLKECFERLDAAESKIELLTKITSAGEAITSSFAEKEMSDEEKLEVRSKRRSHDSGSMLGADSHE